MKKIKAIKEVVVETKEGRYTIELGKEIQEVTDKEIAEGNVYIEIGHTYDFCKKDLRKVRRIDRNEWVVYTEHGEVLRGWKCSPTKKVYIMRKKDYAGISDACSCIEKHINIIKNIIEEVKA